MSGSSRKRKESARRTLEYSEKNSPNASAATRCECCCKFVFESLIMHAVVEETLRCWDGLVTKEKIYGVLKVGIVQEMKAVDGFLQWNR